MLVLGVNKILKWCQVLSNGRKYTCITKDIDGQLCFWFKKAWHPVVNFISDTAHEMIEIDGKTILRPFTNK